RQRLEGGRRPRHVPPASPVGARGVWDRPGRLPAMNFEWEALRVFYCDWEVILQAAVAYTGLTLYRALATVSTARELRVQRHAAIAMCVFFFGAFPLPARPFSGWLVLQHVASVGALVKLGPVVL